MAGSPPCARRYPAAELIITGKLFGSLVAEDLVPTQTLGLALRCILEALRRPLQSKMFKFGVLALEQVAAHGSSGSARLGRLQV